MSRCHSDVILGQQPSQSTVAPVSSQASHCRCQTRTGAGDVEGQRPACSPAPLAPHTALGGAAPAPCPSVCPQAPPGRAPAVWRCCPSPCVPHVVGIEQAAESPTVSVRRRARLAVPSPAVAPTGGLFGSSLHGDSRRRGWEPPPVLDASASEAAGSPGVWGGSCSLGAAGRGRDVAACAVAGGVCDRGARCRLSQTRRRPLASQPVASRRLAWGSPLGSAPLFLFVLLTSKCAASDAQSPRSEPAP